MNSLLNTAIAYLKYRINANQLHGTHSPFVYQLVKDILLDDREYYSFKEIEQIRESLLNNDHKVDFVDKGAGSKKISGDKRFVNKLAKYNAISPKHGRLLFRLVNKYHPENIIELGTSLGIGTSYLSAPDSDIQVHTIDANRSVLDIAEDNFSKLSLKNIQTYCGDFDDILPDIMEKTGKIGMAFIDGNHQYDATIKYFNIFMSNLSENSILVFDDIYWSPGMQKAWEEICSDKRIEVSIDLFRMGILIFRGGMKKQHFILRY